MFMLFYRFHKPCLFIAALMFCVGPLPAIAQSTDYPLTIDNCGHEVTFAAPPERIVLLKSVPVTTLAGIGVFDRVIAKAGFFPPEYYDHDLSQRVDAVPVLSDDLNAAGHLTISQEVVIAQGPDLVLELADGVTRAALGDAGANVLVQEMYCSGDDTPASFDTLYAEIGRYGKIFDRQKQADTLVKNLKARVDAVTARMAGKEKRTAAVLYPSVGGGPVYAYGNESMAQPQLDALGLDNVFSDLDKRVVEIQIEQLIAKNPEVIVVLYQGSPAGIKEAITALPGASNISAVAHDRIITQLFNFTEPASPLNIEGLERISGWLDRLDG